MLEETIKHCKKLRKKYAATKKERVSDALDSIIDQLLNIKRILNIEHEYIEGGLADSVPDSFFDADQLHKGIQVEMEHTDNIAKAKEIAKDHLMEDGRYYEKLEEAGL